MQLISWLSREILYGVIITWCSIFSLFGQNIIASNAKPAVFIQEGVSVPNDESVPTFTPDGHTVYLANGQTICESNWVNGKWSRPAAASFSGQWKDWDPALRPDGKRLVFVSNRPIEGISPDKKNNHLWYVDRLPGGSWSAPHHLEAPVNVDGFNDYGPSVSSSGTICFCSRGRDGYKGMGGYCCKWLGDHYDQPKLLSLNGDNDIFDPFIAPDESYILFASKGDLYISYRHDNGWSAGLKLGEQVNDGGQNGDPYVSPDGKTLYYSSSKVQGIMMIPIHIPTRVN